MYKHKTWILNDWNKDETAIARTENTNRETENEIAENKNLQLFLCILNDQ